VTPEHQKKSQWNRKPNAFHGTGSIPRDRKHSTGREIGTLIELIGMIRTDRRKTATKTLRHEGIKKKEL